MTKTVEEMEARRKELAKARQKKWRDQNKEVQAYRRDRSIAKNFARKATDEDLEMIIKVYQEERKNRNQS